METLKFLLQLSNIFRRNWGLPSRMGALVEGDVLTLRVGEIAMLLDEIIDMVQVDTQTLGREP